MKDLQYISFRHCVAVHEGAAVPVHHQSFIQSCLREVTLYCMWTEVGSVSFVRLSQGQSCTVVVSAHCIVNRCEHDVIQMTLSGAT